MFGPSILPVVRFSPHHLLLPQHTHTLCLLRLGCLGWLFIPCLMPRGTAGLASRFSLFVWSLHTASWVFLTAWGSQSSQVSYIMVGFLSGSVSGALGRCFKASEVLGCPFDCILLVKQVTKAIPDSKDGGLDSAFFFFFLNIFIGV